MKHGYRGRFIHFFAAACVLAATHAQAAIPPSERAVLDAIYAQTGGPNWVNNSGWAGTPGTECTSWNGVVCDAGQTHITQLILTGVDQNGNYTGGNNLVGTFPSISALTQLQRFDVTNDKLSGPLPSLAGLTNLTWFVADGNQFSGAVPPITGLVNLQFYSIIQNQLSGPLPQLSGLSALQSFYAYRNQLSGSIPSLNALPNLKTFFINDNQLSGTLPNLSGLTSLLRFVAQNNQLSGTIPTLTLPNLQQLRLGNNQFTGGIPSFAGLPSLQIFNGYGNKLTGAIPSLQGLPNLIQINVSSNQLTGTIPDLSGHSSLQFFLVDHNQLTGSIPSLSNLPSIDTFIVSANQLTGTLPALSGAANLLDFRAGANQLTGSIPAPDAKMIYFDVSGNRLTGTIPSLTGLNALQYFLVGNNGLSGAVPAPPTTLLAGQSSLCNNALNHTASAAWDAATGASPWYTACTSTPSTLQLSTSDTTVATGTQTTIAATVSVSSTGASPTATGDPPTGSVTITDDNGKVICYIVIVNGTGSCNVVLPGGSTTNLNGGYSGNLNIAPASATIPKTTPITVSGNLDQHGWTGTWYNPATSGQGIVFEIYPDLVSVGTGLIGGGWFTFDTSSGGEDKKRWYTLTGPVSSSSTTTTLDIISPTGGNFNTAPIINAGNGQNWVGHATLNFTDCKHGSLSYSFTDGSGRVGNVPLVRLDENVTCNPTNGAGNGTSPGKFLLSGAWYTPSTSGQGILFDINPVQNITVAAWYTFAPNGQSVGGGASQRWYTLQIPSANVGNAPLNNISVYSAQGGMFDVPGGVTTPQVGSASVAFNNCNSMVLTYNFTAGTNTGQSGTINLQRVGPTPAGCSL